MKRLLTYKISILLGLIFALNVFEARASYFYSFTNSGDPIIYTTGQLDVLPVLICKSSDKEQECFKMLHSQLLAYMFLPNLDQIPTPGRKDSAILELIVDDGGNMMDVRIINDHSNYFQNTFKTSKVELDKNFSWRPGKKNGEAVHSIIKIPVSKIIQNANEMEINPPQNRNPLQGIIALETYGIHSIAHVSYNSNMPRNIPKGGQFFNPFSMTYLIDGKEGTKTESEKYLFSGEYKSMHIQKDKGRMIILSGNHSKADEDYLDSLLKHDKSMDVISRSIKRFPSNHKYVVDGVEMEENAVQKLIKEIVSTNSSADPTLFPANKVGYTEIFTQNLGENKKYPIHKISPSYIKVDNIVRFDVNTLHFAIPLEIWIQDEQNNVISYGTYSLKSKEVKLDIPLPKTLNGKSISVKLKHGTYKTSFRVNT